MAEAREYRHWFEGQEPAAVATTLAVMLKDGREQRAFDTWHAMKTSQQLLVLQQAVKLDLDLQRLQMSLPSNESMVAAADIIHSAKEDTLRRSQQESARVSILALCRALGVGPEDMNEVCKIIVRAPGDGVEEANRSDVHVNSMLALREQAFRELERRMEEKAHKAIREVIDSLSEGSASLPGTGASASVDLETVHLYTFTLKGESGSIEIPYRSVGFLLTEPLPASGGVKVTVQCIGCEELVTFTAEPDKANGLRARWIEHLGA